MTLQPETQDEIFERVRDEIASASDITNFSDNSPERAISDDMFAAEIRERQHELLSAQLSSRVQYAGKDITENDLEELDVDAESVDLELLNSYQEDSDLDALALRNGITRDPGSFATTTVEFTVISSGVTIEEGSQVATEPDTDGDFLTFETTESVTADSTTVTATVQATERGTEHNVAANTITYLPTALSGVSSATNPNAATGGVNEESNSELRERTQNALVNNSGGGTVDGIRGGLVNRFDGLSLNDVIIDEIFDPQPGDKQDAPYADVIVDGGGTDTEVEDAIDDLRNVAIRHYLVRPTLINVNISATVSGSGVDTAEVESDISTYVSALGIGTALVRDQIIAAIINADDAIEGIDSLTIEIDEEIQTYSSGTDVYKLNKGDSMTSDGITDVFDDSGDAYVEDTDYAETTVDGSDPDGIDWSVGGAAPDDTEDFFVTYTIADDLPIGDREKAVAQEVTVQ